MIGSTLKLILHAVRNGRHPSTNSLKTRIARVALKIGALSTIVKAASLGSMLVIASSFGTGDALEAFIVAFLIPSLIAVLISGSLSSAMVPTYVRVLAQHGTEQAQALFSRISIQVIVLLSAVACLCALSASIMLPFVASGFGPAKLALTLNLYYLLLPVIILRGISTLYASLLNARERFTLAAMAPIMVPLSTVALTLIWRVPSTRIYAVAIGTIVGMSAEALVVGWGLRRQGIALLPRWTRRSAASREIVAQYLPMLAGSLLMSGTTFVDQAMAASLSSGSVASLEYGSRIVGVALQIMSGAIGVAVLPFSSRLVHARNWSELRSLLRVYSAWIFLMMAGVTAVLSGLSAPLVGLALERGAFGRVDTLLVGRIQAVYALQIPFYVCGTLFVRVISSMRANHILAVGSFLNLTINIFLNYVFMQVFGVVGIALSTACVYLFSCSYLVFMVHRKLSRMAP